MNKKKKFNLSTTSISYIWNIASIGIMTICGFFMTAAVSYNRGADALGLFNESYAWYMVLSQISVCGIHMSVLKFVPEETIDNKNKIVHSSLVAVIVSSIVLLILGEGILACCMGLLWRTPLMLAIIGIPFFSLNKVLLNYLNALYSMISYAIFQSLRFILLASFVTGLIHCGVDDNKLTLAFPGSEILLCIILFFYIFIKQKEKIRIEVEWIKKVTVFGIKMLPSNLITEMNTKTDVIILGIMLNDSATIGVYSFSILFTEVFYTLLFIVRRMYNPGISEHNSKGMVEKYYHESNKSINKYYLPLSMVVFACVIFAYDFVYRIVGTPDYRVGMIYIAIICTSIVINGKQAIIWGDILCQTGYPLDESRINIITVFSNAVMNVILIKIFGAYGAAFATALSYFITRFLQRKYIRERIGLLI